MHKNKLYQCKRLDFKYITFVKALQLLQKAKKNQLITSSPTLLLYLLLVSCIGQWWNCL